MDSEVYQQFKRFLFDGNRSMRPVYFLISTVVILTVTTQRLKSFAVRHVNTCTKEARRHHTMNLIKGCCSLCSVYTNKTVSLKSTVFPGSLFLLTSGKM